MQNLYKNCSKNKFDGKSGAAIVIDLNTAEYITNTIFYSLFCLGIHIVGQTLFQMFPKINTNYLKILPRLPNENKFSNKKSFKFILVNFLIFLMFISCTNDDTAFVYLLNIFRTSTNIYHYTYIYKVCILYMLYMFCIYLQIYTRSRKHTSRLGIKKNVIIIQIETTPHDHHHHHRRRRRCRHSVVANQLDTVQIMAQCRTTI